jgi:hypothetical protein
MTDGLRQYSLVQMNFVQCLINPSVLELNVR